MNVLELDGVSRTYDGDVPALRPTSLSVSEGDSVAIVGPSGSGKTTLLNLMGTLDRPDTGEVRVAGESTRRLAEDELSRMRAKKIGFVFQQPNLVGTFSALQNVVLGLLYTDTPRRRRIDLAREALRRVGLSERSDHRPGELSGGERQRVGIARALVSRPVLLLADEPTGALDQHTGHAVLDLFDELHAHGTTVVLITHDRGVAARFNRHITIRDGVVTESTGAYGWSPR